MIDNFINNMIAFILSMPINLVIIGIVCIILYITGRTFSSIIRVFIAYFCVCFILSIFGVSLPSIPALFHYTVELFNYVKNAL